MESADKYENEIRERRVNLTDGAIFVLGNGPSLAGVDLPRLSSCGATLGMNAAYRYWREIGWRPRYYACLDLVVGLSHRKAIADLIDEKGGIELFLLRANLIDSLGDIALSDKVINFDAFRLREPLLQDDPVTTGSHAALWAATLGYQTIIIAGVDGHYREIVHGARKAGGIELEVVEDAENPNYFFQGYQRPGDRYNIPNPRPGLHTGAWESAARRLSNAGVCTANANSASEVRAFPFIDIDELLGEGSAKLRLAEKPRDNFALKMNSDGRIAAFLRSEWKLAVVSISVIALTFCLGVIGGSRWTIAISGALIGGMLAMAVIYVRFIVRARLTDLVREVRNSRVEAGELRRQLKIAEKTARSDI